MGAVPERDSFALFFSDRGSKFDPDGPERPLGSLREAQVDTGAARGREVDEAEDENHSFLTESAVARHFHLVNLYTVRNLCPAMNCLHVMGTVHMPPPGSV